MINSLYIHIPFCRNKCAYCDFYSIAYQPEVGEAYIEALCRQLENYKPSFKTIYIGGGTPSILDLRLWQKLLNSLAKVSKGVEEFTVEANPESLDEAKLKLWFEEGVNRISIGLQSLDDRRLKQLGRIHSAQEALEGIRKVRSAGFNNISIDLIFGLWDQDLESWKRELEEAVKLPVEHISLYALSYEKNTDLFRKLKQGQLKPLAEQLVAQMYEFSIEYLNRQGFLQYEISNFSKKGYQCKHNLNYWDNNSYQALGASAASYIEGVRQKNVCDVRDYIRRVKRGESVVASCEELLLEARAKETAAVKIRTQAGIDFNWFKAKTGFDFLSLEQGVLGKLAEEGLIAYQQTNGAYRGISLTSKGFLFSDSVSAAFL